MSPSGRPSPARTHVAPPVVDLYNAPPCVPIYAMPSLTGSKAIVTISAGQPGPAGVHLTPPSRLSKIPSEDEAYITNALWGSTAKHSAPFDRPEVLTSVQCRPPSALLTIDDGLGGS